MQAIVLAAGMGTRLGLLTKEMPKCMVKVNGESLLERNLSMLSKYNQIDEVILVVGYHAEAIKTAIGDTYAGMKITYVYNHDYNSTNNIYSLWLAKNFINSDVLLLEGDLIFDQNLITEALNNDNRNLVMLDHYKSGMDGTVVTLNSKTKEILKFISKKEQGQNFDFNEKYKTINVYTFTFDFFKNIYIPKLEEYMANRSLNKYYEEVLNVVIEAGYPKLYGHVVENCNWGEIDDQNDLEKMEYLFSSSNDKLNRIKNQWGGYWEYKFVDHNFLYNLYFPPVQFYNELKLVLPQLVMNYPSGARTQEGYLSRWFDVEPKKLVVANGSAEIIKVLNTHFLNRVCIPVPTFNEYGSGLDESDKFYFELKEDGFSLNEERLVEYIEENKCNSLVIVNPNNPTSLFESKDKMEYVLNRLKHLDLIVIDESFMDFVEVKDKSLISELDRYPNLLILKSISKEFGVAGLRLGYATSSNIQLIDKIKDLLPIWNINSLAEFFLDRFLKYKKDYTKSLEKINLDKNLFYNKLKEISWLRVYPPSANYIFAKFSEPDLCSEFVLKLFEEHNILIKECSGKKGLGDDKYFRITVRTHLENMSCVEKMLEVYSSLKGYNSRGSKWKSIWEKKGSLDRETYTFSDLIAMDGFDTKTGTLGDQDFLKIVSKVSNELSISEGDSVCEIGCGAGAFLLGLMQSNNLNVTGFDYSESLIKVANKAMPNQTFICQDAKEVHIEPQSQDAIFSHSVFFYFPDYEYALTVVKKMVNALKPGSKGAILDVPNLELKDECEAERRSTWSEEVYKERYSGLEHLYYSKEWFADVLNDLGCSVKFYDNNDVDYGNSRFRFNVIFTKN